MPMRPRLPAATRRCRRGIGLYGFKVPQTAIQVNIKILLPFFRILQLVRQLFILAAQGTHLRFLRFKLRLQVNQGTGLLFVGLRLPTVGFGLLLAGIFKSGNTRIDLLYLLPCLIIGKQARMGLSSGKTQAGKQQGLPLHAS